MKKLLPIILIFHFCQIGFTQIMSYDSLLFRINELEKAKAYDQALLFVKQHLSEYPEQWFELSKELIFLNEKNKRIEDNPAIFNEAHRRGYFYFIHPRMKEYKDYLDIPGFDSISKIDLQLAAEANRKSSTRFEIQLPDSYDGDHAYPLVFLLHGGGKNLNDVKQHWQGEYLNRAFIKVYLQSYRHFDSKTFGWGNKDEKLDQEITAIYKQIVEQKKVDSSMVFVCGMSAGASAALDLSLRNIIPARGVLAICPTIPQKLREKNFDLVSNRNLKVLVVAGENDHFLEQQKQMNILLDQLKITHQHIILEGMGHQYPENETKYFKEFIDGLNLKN